MSIELLLGKTLVSVIGGKGDDEIIFTTDSGEKYLMYHQQDCCESVWVEDVEGDLQGLVGNPILVAEEVVSYEGEQLDKWDDSYTWTFYKLATIKGHVDIRWYGTSNGYYSESVDFVKVN